MGIGFLRELCVSLTGEWEPDRLFMLFKAYMDESDTHGKTPDMVMSAMLGDGRQWELFGRGLRRLRRDYGFSVFHATQFKARQGDFKDWPDQKFEDFLHEFGKLVGDTLTDGMCVSLKYAVYKEGFLDTRPKKMHRTSQYGLCFFALLEKLSERVRERGQNHRLSVIVESGHENAAETAEIFKQRQTQLRQRGFDFLKSHTLASKKDTPLLMIADVIAFGSSKDWRAIAAGEKPHYSERPMIPPQEKEVGWTVMEILPENLKALVDGYNRIRALRDEEHFKRKAAWQASQVPPASEEQPS